MVSLTLMARLLEAVRPDARLVLVGDPDQLASVEAGAVLGDLVAAPADPEPVFDRALERVGAPGPPVRGGVTVLDRTWRFHGTIATLAAAIREGDADAAVAALRAGHHDVVFVEDADLTTRDPGGLRELREEVVGGAAETELAALDGDASLALTRLDEHRLLCAHRRGPWGVDPVGRRRRALGARGRARRRPRRGVVPRTPAAGDGQRPRPSASTTATPGW